MRAIAKTLTLAFLMLVLPFRLEMDANGDLALTASFAEAKSGSGSGGDGRDRDDDDRDDRDDDRDDRDDDDRDDRDDDRGRDDRDDDRHRYLKKNNYGNRPDRDPGGDEKVRATRAQKLFNGARITFSDGSFEEIKDGQFLRGDATGRLIEKRHATGSDLARLRAYFGISQSEPEQTSPAVESHAVKAIYRGKNIDILYANGWREQIISGRYSITDKYGRVITSRNATADDIVRLNRFRN